MTAIPHKLPPSEQQLKEILPKLLGKNKCNSALSYTKQLTEICLTLARQKSKQLVDNLPKEYSNNMEQQLWKTCFYKAIETLRKADIEEIRPAFVAFIEAAIQFYGQLIKDYEDKFDLSFQQAMYWELDQVGDTLPQMNNAILADKINLSKFEGGKAKLALRSVQRHFLAVGDLYRYRALINKTDFLDSKRQYYKDVFSWYIKAIQANFSNGRSFNQLAVLAVQSQHYLDMVFYYVQALAAKYPFENSRESLELAFNDIRNMAISNYSDINQALGKNVPPTKKDGAKARKPKPKTRTENKHQEVWIHTVNGKRQEQKEHIIAKIMPQSDPNIFNGRLAPDMDVKLEKQAIIHLLHTLGILVTNISMEEFSKVSDISICLISSMLERENSLATSSTLLKVTLMAIFAAHHVKKGTTATMAETQQKYALEYLLNLLSLFLDELHKDMNNLGLYLLTGKASDRLERVLPSISILCNWLMSSTTLNILLELQSNVGLLVKSSVFLRITEVANKLTDMCQKDQLLKGTLDCRQTGTTDSTAIYLPEFIVSSGFSKIFSPQPVKILVQNCEPTNLSMLALHIRLNTIIAAAEHLSSYNLFLNKLESNQKIYFEVQKTLLNANVTIKDNKSDKQRIATNIDIDNDQSSQEEELADFLVKQLVMDEEESSSQHKWILEVRPQYLIPDTNTFVDHLIDLKKIVGSKQFTVLVPTTVIAELSSLALDASSAHSFLSSEMLLGNNTQLKYVIKQAKATLDYLKTAAGEHNLATITSNGNILPRLSFAYEVTDCAEKRTNDDRILAACVTLADKQQRSLESDYHNQTTKIKRNVVFLTEDRALSVKAIAARIPVRTVPELLRWAAI